MQPKQATLNPSPSSPNSYQNPSGLSSTTQTPNTTQAPQTLSNTPQANQTPNNTLTKQTPTQANTGAITPTQSAAFTNTPTTSTTSTPTSGISTDYQGGWSIPTVDDEINRLTAGDSLTMQQARQEGLRSAGARGLLNSSIAGQASQQAAIQAASPIAQQNVSNQLQQQQFAQGITANTHGQYMQATNDILNQALISINEIETATNINQAEKDKMIANTIQRRDEDLKFMQTYYSMMPTWSGNWVNFPTMPEAPGIK